MHTRTYHVYILASRTRALYIGVTNNLERRLWQHKNHVVAGFTAQYRVVRLVYFEETADVLAAIAREKELKGWRRAKKLALIEAVNADWKDLSEGWW